MLEFQIILKSKEFEFLFLRNAYSSSRSRLCRSLARCSQVVMMVTLASCNDGYTHWFSCSMLTSHNHDFVYNLHLQWFRGLSYAPGDSDSSLFPIIIAIPRIRVSWFVSSTSFFSIFSCVFCAILFPPITADEKAIQSNYHLYEVSLQIPFF